MYFTYFVFISLLLFLSQTASKPILAQPSPTAGPLGSQGSESQGTVPAGDANSSTAAGGTPFGLHIQIPATSIAVACAILTTFTYGILIGPGTRLLSTSKIPLGVIETNVGNLLSETWPDSSDTTATTHRARSQHRLPDAIRLFNAGTLDEDAGARLARGVVQCIAHPDPNEARANTHPMWLTTGSMLTKSTVQLSVWEWISVWISLGMLISTLAFNGFLTGEPGPDSYPRLVVVLIYAVAYLGHGWYVWKKITSFFTLLAAGASWSLLHKAGFLSVDLSQLESHLSPQNGGGPSPVFKQVGKPTGSPLFPVVGAVLCHDSARVQPVTDDHSSDQKRSEGETVASWGKRDITGCIEAGNSALNFIITNVMTMLGITITTGFSVWTTNESSAVSQLGSLALLGSLTLGVGAMFSSAIELSVMESSFRNVLLLKEVMINGQASSHVSKRASTKQVLGFTHGSVNARKLGVRELLKVSRPLQLMIWGPAVVLLPTEEDHTRQLSGVEFEFRANIRGKAVTFTTKSTTRRKADVESSVDTVNAYYEPPELPSKPNTPPADSNGRTSNSTSSR